MTAEPVQREAWKVPEFAAAMGSSRDHIYKLCREGKLGWFWLGGSMRIPNAELQRLMGEAAERRTA